MSTIEAITYYWRPGCPFCMALESGLEKYSLPMEKHNIWDEPDAAAFVRSVADGNEVVPTVTVGATSMVNPSPAEVIAALKAEAPHLVPEGV